MSKYPGRVVTDLAPAGYSVFFDGTGDYLTGPTNTATAFNLTGNFTIECWAYFNSVATSFAGLVSWADSSGWNGWQFLNNAGTLTFEFLTGSAGAGTTTSSAGALTTGRWFHLAAVRSGSTITLYINGVSSGTPVTYSSSQTSSSSFIKVAADRLATALTTGYISNVRVVNGTALYTAAFTPPTQLFNIPNTSLLTCNSPAIIDQSNNAFAITVNGNAAVSTLTPFTAYVPYNPALGASTPGVWTLDEALQAKGTRRWNMYDPYFNQTTLLLHGNGTNTAQNNTFLDSSSNNFTITRNPASGPNAPTQGSFSPFSQTGWSNHFGSSTSNLKFASDAAFAVGNSNFTVECFVNFTAWASTNQRIFVQGQSGTDNLTIQRDSGANNLVVNIQGSSSISYAWSPNIGQWYHIAVVKSGTGTGQVAVYIDGLSVATGTSSTSISQNQVLIGGIDWASGYNMQGYISNLRYTIGAALYTGNFTPSTAPLTTTSQGATASQVEILTCQSNRFVDNSTNGFAITVNGTTSVQSFSPFYPTAAYTPATVGGSGYFDGTGDYLTAAGNAAFAFGTGDFTVAAWVYPTNTLATTVLSSNYNYSSGVGNWSLYFSSGTPATLYFNSSSGNKASTVTTTIPLNAWTHVAYTRVGTTGRFFVNGAQLGGTISDSFNYGGSSGNLFVGQQNDGTGLWYGYMTSIQVLKGTGYSSLPIPTTPATNITNTSLLLNFTNAGIVDSTAKNDLETVGNAQISTTQSKFGGSSMYFDGTGDYLQIPSSNLLAFGSSPYTVELWLYPNNVANLQGLFTMGAFRFFQNTTGLWFLSSSSTIISVATGLSTGQWFHIALVREGTGTSQTKLYLNGSSIGTGTDANTWAAAIAYVGSEGASNQLNGYIDDLRITRFARYTGNFTPPTSQWQDE